MSSNEANCWGDFLPPGSFSANTDVNLEALWQLSSDIGGLLGVIEQTATLQLPETSETVEAGSLLGESAAETVSDEPSTTDDEDVFNKELDAAMESVAIGVQKMVETVLRMAGKTAGTAAREAILKL